MTHEFYKRYRPREIEDFLGNSSTILAFVRMVDKGKVPHTILFSGPSGCGKTTLARILRRRLGCHDLDFAEVNCAQSRGVDTIREIQGRMSLSPTGKCRVWLLDEAHQLTSEAQNAALKLLEDTPGHVYFFLATTNPGKLLPTIRTRCTDLPVQLLDDKEMKRLVERVAKKEDLKLKEEIVLALIDEAGGSARKALVLLDKIQGLKSGEQEAALKTASEDQQEAIELARALCKGESWGKVAKILRALKTDPEGVRRLVLAYARSTLLGSGSKSAYFVIQAFQHHFYDSGEAGLASACYEVIHGEG